MPTELTEDRINALIKKFKDTSQDLNAFSDTVAKFFSNNPAVCEHVHTVKYRLKSESSLIGKFHRKWNRNDPITPENLYSRVTDLAGVRVLHIHREQFSSIKSAIDERLRNQEWHQVEPPKAYTWDPEAKVYFQSLGIEVTDNERFYTSVHYLIKEHADSDIYCEIQIRTLFEEIWGEVDHSMNYPVKTLDASCKDQLLVLAKLVGAGSRLVDSIFSTHNRATARSPDKA